jgi:NAD(P) transhydrogenase subunit alpha
MLIGIPAETAKKLKAQGHRLFVQSGAGVMAAAPDAAYAAIGAEVVDARAALDRTWRSRCERPRLKSWH